MKKLLLPPLVTLVSAFLLMNATGPAGGETGGTTPVYQQADTVEFDQEETLATLRERIKGHENQPAGEVFENIQILKQMPAGRLLRVMEMGYGRSLGVTCTHCHNAGNFASEEKRQKQIARDMMAMVGRINSELLASIDNLESDNPTVNCTTCHRGQVTPALNMDDR